MNTLKQPSFQEFPATKLSSFGVNAFFVAMSLGLSILLASVIANYVLPLWDHVETNGSLVYWVQAKAGTFNLTTGFISMLGVMLIAYYIFGKNKPYWMNPRNLAVKKTYSVALGSFLVGLTVAGSITLSVIPSIANGAIDLSQTLVQYQTYKQGFNQAYLVQDKVDGYYDLKQYLASSDTCSQMNKSVEDYVASPMTTRISGVLRKNFIASAMRSGCMSPNVAYELSTSLHKRAGRLQFGFEKVMGLVMPSIKESTDSVVSKVAFSQRDWCHNLISVDKSNTNSDLWNECNKMSSEPLTSLPSQTSATDYIKAIKQAS